MMGHLLLYGAGAAPAAVSLYLGFPNLAICILLVWLGWIIVEQFDHLTQATAQRLDYHGEFLRRMDDKAASLVSRQRQR